MMENGFVAVNRISVREGYHARFEELFGSRAKAIDRFPGFQHMQVLKPSRDGEPYLIVSHWQDETAFRAWVGSPEFIEGHRRGFQDLADAKARGEEPPMTSDFVTYDVIAR